MNRTNEPLTSRLPHRVAVLLAFIVFPLIWVGGLVTTYDAGMAVPDWPNTYNYNMFSYPVRDWFFGPWDLFVEHGHRLLGSLAGLVAIVLVIVTGFKETRPWVFRLSIAILLLVIAQGVLGGARVLMAERTLAKIHGCVGPAFFAAVVGFCVCTSRWWNSAAAGADGPLRTRRILSGGASAMLVFSYAQLVLGALIRHIAVDAKPGLFFGLIWMHVALAVVLVLGALFQLFWVHRATPSEMGLRGSIRLLFLLILIQFGLGMTTWVVKYGWPIWFEDLPFAAQFVVAEKTFLQMNLVTAHVAIGSLILATLTLHCVRCWRVFLPRWSEQKLQQAASFNNETASISSASV